MGHSCVSYISKRKRVSLRPLGKKTRSAHLAGMTVSRNAMPKNRAPRVSNSTGARIACTSGDGRHNAYSIGFPLTSNLFSPCSHVIPALPLPVSFHLRPTASFPLQLVQPCLLFQKPNSCLPEKAPPSPIGRKRHPPSPFFHLFISHPSLARSMCRFL